MYICLKIYNKTKKASLTYADPRDLISVNVNSHFNFLVLVVCFINEDFYIKEGMI